MPKASGDTATQSGKFGSVVDTVRADRQPRALPRLCQMRTACAFAAFKTHLTPTPCGFHITMPLDLGPPGLEHPCK